MSGYEYGNTRLRAMRARLLTRQDYADMMEAGSLDRMLAILADTPYAPDIEAALVRARGLDRLDRALRSNLGTTLHRVAEFYEGRPRELVELLLSRWDLRNLRTLVRLTSLGTPLADPGRLLVPAGRLDEGELAEMAAQDDVGGLVDLMVSWGIPSPESAFALLRARAAYVEGGDVSRLEQTLDQVYADKAEQTLGQDDGVAANVLRAEIDARNLELALRLRASRLDDEPGWSAAVGEFTSGGRLAAELWTRIAETDSPEVVAELAGARSPVEGWKRALAEWVPEADIATLSDGLQKAITNAARARFVTGDPLGFDIPLAYTFAKEAEVRNLSLVGRGLVHGIPISEVEESLEVAA